MSNNKSKATENLLYARILEFLKVNSEGALLYSDVEIVEKILDEVYNERLRSQLNIYYE